MQRQLALKMMVIVVVGVLVLIPISMVKYKIYERQGYLELAKSAVAQSWTGQQLITTPVLVIPYVTRPVTVAGFYSDNAKPVVAKAAETKRAIVLPSQTTNQFNVDNKSVFKGIYEVPVYDGHISLSGTFTEDKLQHKINKIKQMPRFESIGEPYFAIHISDMRGIDQRPELLINQRSIKLEPGSQMSELAAGLHGVVGGEINGDLVFFMSLSLRGMESLSFVPLADDAMTQMQSNWPHPAFIGASLPKEREIAADGFKASWSSSRYASDSAGLLFQCMEESDCHSLKESSSGVRFIEPVDIYLQSERSIKYAVLFIGLSFITFFIFEHLANQPIHPIQYAFVGLSISVFYLLLISLAEHIAFRWAYLMAVICCSSLIMFYVRYMLRSALSAALFSAMIVGLYGLLYVIVRAEDFALLMGSILVFLVLVALMYVTRKIDWYDLSLPEK